MILEKMIKNVQYPDQINKIGFGSVPYDHLILKLRKGIEESEEPFKADFVETLKELENRWEKRRSNLTIEELKLVEHHDALDMIARIVGLYREGAELEKIAKKLNISEESVIAILLKCGYKEILDI